MIKLQCIGYVAREPNIKEGQLKIAGFSVGCKAKDGTTWIDCSAFGKVADIVEAYIHKGSQVFVDGAAKLNTYKAKDGTDKTTLQVTVSQIEIINNKQKESDDLPF